MRHVRRAEEHPCQGDDQEGDSHFQVLWQCTVETVFADGTLEGQHASVYGSPSDEVPGSTMPHAAEQHDQGEVDVGACVAALVSTQGDVKVVTQPRGKRDMPTSPELGDGFGVIRRIEILSEYETEHTAQADGHIGIATEVEVDLKGVGNGAHPGIQHAHRGRVKGQVSHLATGVGQQHLLGHAHAEKGNPTREQLPRMCAFTQLIRNFLVAHNGAGHQLREHRNITGKIDETTVSFRLTAVNINGVAH